MSLANVHMAPGRLNELTGGKRFAKRTLYRC
jgi:hypothetical protein